MSKRLMFATIGLLVLWFAYAGYAAPESSPATQPEPPLPAEALKSSPQYSASMPAATLASVVSPILLDAPPSRAPAQPPVSASRAFTKLCFTEDCPLGTKDDCGQWIAGTETMRLLQHQGKLFASTEAWTDRPYFQGKGEQPWTGSQILVKESVSAPWRVDMGFPSAIRLAAMTSATFITDGSGRKLDPPVTLLIASPSSGNTTTWTRDDARSRWSESMVKGGLRGGLRSFCTHLDAATKVQYLFGGSGDFAETGSVFRAVYDVAAPGHIRWHEAPELSGVGRVMCMTEANGVLYAACGIKSEKPLSGGLFRRVDGEKPRWELLWRWPHKIQVQGDELEIMRGLTAVADPKGGAHQVLLGTCNYPGVVYRIDPARNLEITTELDIRAYFAKAFGVSALRGPCLSAYNNFLAVTEPDTGENVHLLGVWINHPGGHATDLGGSAWYLIRHSDGSYGYGCVFDPNHPRPNPPRGLLATRTIEISPFPEDKGRTLYFGGYDCASIESHNTAWIYKGTMRPVESKEEER